MSKSKHSEAQMIAALKQVEAGRNVEDVAREQGVSKHTLYAWKAKYGGMDVSEAQVAVRRAEVRRLVREHCASERRACELMGIPRMTYRYQSRRDDNGLREQLLELAREKPRYGYRRPHVLLRREGSARINAVHIQPGKPTQNAYVESFHGRL